MVVLVSESFCHLNLPPWEKMGRESDVRMQASLICNSSNSAEEAVPPPGPAAEAAPPPAEEEEEKVVVEGGEEETSPSWERMR